jgi:hypothetical protein
MRPHAPQRFRKTMTKSVARFAWARTVRKRARRSSELDVGYVASTPRIVSDRGVDGVLQSILDILAPPAATKIIDSDFAFK